MQELDKRIAELKGLDFFDPSIKNSIGIVRHDIQRLNGEGPMRVVESGWSQSDAKAFELVDELTGPKPNTLGELVFHLWQDIKTWRWHAGFCYLDPRNAVNKINFIEKKGEGLTRAEAICRAYIAAKEWMEKRKEGEG